ncbi:dihydropteroate synthase [Thermodesulfobacteriota bacterium]
MILVADNLRITDSTIQNAIKNRDRDQIYSLTERLVNAGAGAIDINPGPLTKEADSQMKFFVDSVRVVTDLPLLLDTTNPEAIRAGLSAGKTGMIINGFSLEPCKLEQILPLAKEFDVDIIGFLLNSDSQPPADIQDRLNIAVELFQKCREAGISENRLIIDPVVAPLLWNNGATRNMELLEIIRLLPDILGFQVRTIAGLSNLTSGISDKEKKLTLQKAYLPMLASSGLTMLLMDILNTPVVNMANTCNSLTGKKTFTLYDF